MHRKLSQGDTVKIKKNTKGYCHESGFIYSKDRKEDIAYPYEIPDEVINFFIPKVWIAINEHVFLFIEESFLVKSKIVLVEKKQSMI